MKTRPQTLRRKEQGQWYLRQPTIRSKVSCSRVRGKREP